MHLLIYQTPSDETETLAMRLFPEGASWVQFGNRFVVFAERDKLDGLSQFGKKMGLVERTRIDASESLDLHLVTQKGRLFQKTHQNVRVVLDCGRYLAVDLGKQDAHHLQIGPEPCFDIQPLTPNSIVFATHSALAGRSMPVPWIQQLLTQVSHSYYRHVIEHLVSFSTRHSTSEHYQTAAVWCRREFTRLGYDASLQVVRLDEGNSYNVIADKSGFGAERRKLLLLVAHLDSINSVGGQLAAAPGADDNASGCAGALSIADALKDHCAVNDLRIVLFGGEEQGLLGSIQYVEETAATELDRVAAVVNMDMIASMNTPTPTVLLEGSVVSHAVINQLKQAAATYTSLTVQTSLNAFGSDHVPFIRANIPAVLAIEGADRSNENIHTDKDVLAYLCDSLALDIQKMTLSFLAKELGNYGH